MCKVITLELKDIKGTIGCKIGKCCTYDIKDNTGKVIGYIRMEERPNSLYVNNIEIYRDFLNQGWGTAVIENLRNNYKGYYISGDILYPGAWKFWRKFDNSLNNFSGNEPDLTFEFKL